MHHSTSYVKEFPLPTQEELDAMILRTKNLASQLIEILGIPEGFEQDCYTYANNRAERERTAYNTEVQLQCHFWRGTQNSLTGELFVGANRASKVDSVNHKRRTHYESAFAPIMRVAELEMLRDHYYDISAEKAAADQATLKLRSLFNSSCANYWVRNGISLVSNHKAEPSLTTSSREAGYNHRRNSVTFDWERVPLYRASATISLNHKYMTEVGDRDLFVMNCNGKTGFPINATPIPLPKKCDPSYELYSSKVIVIFPKKIESAESEAEALSGYQLEDRYICVGHTNGGERIVSCSTTPGRAVGGVNVKTKNKVLDTLDFSF